MTKGTILFVEDEPDYQLIVTNTLEEAGFTTRVAGSAEEALDMILRERPALLLLDINLPGIDGYEFCRRLRLEDYGKDIPILMLTVRRRPDEWLKGFSMGANNYLSKPFNPPDLIENVRSCLNRKGETRLSEDIPEHQLIEAAIAGNRPAFEILIEQYKTPLMNTVMAQGVREADAEELVSAALARAFAKLRSYRGKSSFLTWLTTIALHLVQRRGRQLAAIPLEHLTEEEESAVSESGVQSPENNLGNSETSDLSRLEQAVREVPVAYRRPLELFYVKRFSYDKIAEHLDLPVGTVMSRLHRARTYLRKAWQRNAATPPAA